MFSFYLLLGNPYHSVLLLCFPIKCFLSFKVSQATVVCVYIWEQRQLVFHHRKGNGQPHARSPSLLDSQETNRSLQNRETMLAPVSVRPKDAAMPQKLGMLRHQREKRAFSVQWKQPTTGETEII